MTPTLISRSGAVHVILVGTRVDTSIVSPKVLESENPNMIPHRPIARIALACILLAALPPGSGAASPIFGTFHGLWGYHQRVTVDGDLLPGANFDASSEETMIFMPAHAAKFTNFDASWSKSGGSWSIDASEGAREFFETQTGDPNVKTKLVNRSIRLANDSTITGNASEKLRYRATGQVVKRSLKGPYLGTKTSPT